MFERQPRNYCISYTKITDHKTEIHVKAPEPLKKDNEKSEYPEESDNRLEASDERPHKSQRSEEDEKHPESSDEDPHKPQLDREGIENLASFINRNAEPAMQYRVYSRQHRTGNKKSRGKKHHRAPTPREIHFSHLPPYVSAQEVSSMVRGGPVLFLSVTMEKEFSEARIIFAFGAHATQYLKWVHSAPVTLHSDPFCITSKIAPETDNVIHRAMIRENARRVLIFDPFISAGKEINPDVLWDLIMGCSFESNPIESIGISSDRTGLKVVLRSIAEAIYIKEALNKLGYGSKFGRDETEGTIDELPLNRNFGEWFEKERDFTKDSL
ncbi:hypothetical protein EDC01DRAFT_358971 [Geopyxis carbonaria]|nr:hypothetical protein EDC01DRAFT_358971 [Geopyxis carbonaria]